MSSMLVASLTPWIPILTAVISVGGVGMTLIVTGRRAKADRLRADKTRTQEADAQRAATRERFLGVTRVVEDRLDIVRQIGGFPIEGYTSFERFLSVAYSGEVSALAANAGIAVEYFSAVGKWEQAVAAARSSIEKITSLTHSGEALRNIVEEEREAAIAAADEAFALSVKIRAMFGDESTPERYQSEMQYLAPSVRQKRKGKAAFQNPPP